MLCNRLSVDLIGPYKTRREGHDNYFILKMLTMIYPATGWFVIVQQNDKQSASIANLVDQEWLCRYKLPTIVMYDREK